MAAKERPWTFESIVDWFETEGSVFITREGGVEARLRVVVSSQGEDQVIKSLWEYLVNTGFHPSFRRTRQVLRKGLKRKRSAECELLSNREQECFLRQALPLLRTEKRRREASNAIVWLGDRRRLPGRVFKDFSCPELLPGNGGGGSRTPDLLRVRETS